MGYAFVDLSTADEAQKAIGELSGKEVLERKVSVQLARKPETAAEKAEAAASGGEGVSGGEGRRRSSGRGRGRGRGRGGRGGRGGRSVRWSAQSTSCALLIVWCCSDKRLEKPPPIFQAKLRLSQRPPTELLQLPSKPLRALLMIKLVLLVNASVDPRRTVSHLRARSWSPIFLMTLARTR